MRIVKILLAVAVLLSSCSIQRRHYMKGLYFEKHSSKKQERTEGSTIESFYKEGKDARVIEKKETETITASVKAATKPGASEIKEPSPVNPVVLFENCDTLFFRDGTVIAAKVVELNSTEIKYRYCSGGETEVLRVVLKTSVEQIVYSNGLKEAFEKPKPVVNNYVTNQLPRKKASKSAVAGFILSLSSYGVFLFTLFIWALAYGAIGAEIFIFPGLTFLLGLIFSIAGINQINTNKEKYKGMAFGVLGLIFAMIAIFILLLLFMTGAFI